MSSAQRSCATLYAQMPMLDRVRSALGLGSAAPVAVGQRAPDFRLTDSDGQPVTLGQLISRGPVLLAFFPRAFTGGCTREMKAYTSQHADLEASGARVVGISVDDVDTLARFKASLKAPYTFLSDPDGAVAKQYAGVSMGTANRVTVMVAPDRTITRITTGLAAIFPGSDIAACNARGNG
jgi:thioredoxin-dependent peroxiredoxin